MIIKRVLGPKGQIVIPRDVRDLLGLKPGSEVILEVTGNEVKIKPAVSNDEFLARFCEMPAKLHEKIDLEKLMDQEYLNED
ncbi:MAG TPA: AbrB/MazE/SpoVT family DNA-binding domain-containing protein [Candidatus Lokiarchaeia archaeon]|nr:AbrB/MazE/SpoVT family DNA-binding domain-containing protein [Candidatus Lokiarchaeia archaeon]